MRQLLELAATMSDTARRALACLAAILLVACPAAAAEREPISIESLLKDGWQIAGYTGTFDVRSTLLLFRHPSKDYLVQCSTIYDVTRSPRTVVNCYELH